jgi:hypothetical protein
MATPLRATHLATLRAYLGQAENAHPSPYPSVDAVRELAERVRRHLAAAPSGSAEQDAALFQTRDVQLLTTLSRSLVESATPLLPTRRDANDRLALGRSLLEVRDAVQDTLIGSGNMPERRARGR